MREGWQVSPKLWYPSAVLRYIPDIRYRGTSFKAVHLSMKVLNLVEILNVMFKVNGRSETCASIFSNVPELYHV